MTKGGRNRLIVVGRLRRSRTAPRRPTCSRRPGASRACSPMAGSSPSSGRGASTAASASSCRSPRARRTSRSAAACRSSRSRSTARAGSGSGARSGCGWASRIQPVGRAYARGGRRADRGSTDAALLGARRRLPRPAATGHARPLAHRGVQRLAGGRAAGARPGRRGGPPDLASRAASAAAAEPGSRRSPPRPRAEAGWHPAQRPPHAPGDLVGATGLSADPTEYRARLADQPDAQIDTWASELMRDVAMRRGIVRVVADFRPVGEAQRARIRTGVRFWRWPARDGREGRRGPPVVPAVALWALVPGDPVAGRRRARPADRVPRRELRRARLRLIARARRPASAFATSPPLARLVHPFPSILDGAVVALVALVAGGAAPVAIVLGLSMTLLQFAIGTVNDLVDAPRGRRPQARQADPRGPRDRPRRTGRSRSCSAVAGCVLAIVGGPWLVALAARRARDRARVRPVGEGDDALVAAVRRGHPAPAGLRLVRGDRRRCPSCSSCSSPPPRTPAPRSPSPTPWSTRSATRRPA